LYMEVGSCLKEVLTFWTSKKSYSDSHIIRLVQDQFSKVLSGELETYIGLKARDHMLSRVTFRAIPSFPINFPCSANEVIEVDILNLYAVM
jgi:hypothetical protein